MLRKYLHSIGVIGITEVILRFKGVILIPVLAQYLGTLNYGLGAQVSVIASMLLPIALLGTNTASLRALPGEGLDRQLRGIFTLGAYYLIVAAAATLLLWSLSRPLADSFFGGREQASFVMLCSGVLASGLLTGLCHNYFQITGRTKSYAVMNLLQSAYSIGIAVGVVLMKGSIATLIFIEFSCDLLVAGGVLLYTGIKYGFYLPDWSLLKRFVKYGLPLVPAGYAAWMLNLSDRMVLSKYCGVAEVGVYSCIYSLGCMVIQLCFNPIWLMYPSMAAELYNRGQHGDLGNLFRQSTRLALGGFIPAVAGMALISDPILRLFATAEFAAESAIMPVVALGYMFLMLAAYFDVALGLAGKQAWTTVAVCVAATFNLGVNLWWIPRYGITGAAFAKLTGFALQFAIVLFVGRACMPFPFDWRFFGKVLAATAGMGMGNCFRSSARGSRSP